MKQIIRNEVNAFESFKNTFGVSLPKHRVMEELRTDYKDYKAIYPQVMSQLIANKYYN